MKTFNLGAVYQLLLCISLRLIQIMLFFWLFLLSKSCKAINNLCLFINIQLLNSFHLSRTSHFQFQISSRERLPRLISNVHGFKGSWVQNSILILGPHSESVFSKRGSSLADLILNLEPNRQLPGKISSCNEDFGASIPF